MKQPVCSTGDHLRSQEFCPKARKIRAILDTHQDIIGHDALVSRILLDHNEHGAFEGHGKANVTSKVSDPPFTKEDSNEKSCSLDDFLVAKLAIKREITALGRPSHQLIGWKQNVPLHFDLEKHHCSQEERKLIC